jgi:hypothetical protein
VFNVVLDSAISLTLRRPMEATHGANVFGFDVIDRLDLEHAKQESTIPQL